MSSFCMLCFEKHDDSFMTPCLEPKFDGQNLLFIFNSISTVKLEKSATESTKVCQNCTETIINFQNLIANFKKREKCPTLNNTVNVKNDLYFFDEQEYDNYNECEVEVESCLDKEECLDTNKNSSDKVSSDWIAKDENQMKIVMLPDLKVNVKVFDEFGNEEIHSRKYTCDECGDSFLYKVGFSSHMVQKHGVYIENDNYDQYSTEITVKIPPASNDINFIRKSPKKSVRTDETANKCQICKKILSSVEELKEHQNSHKTHICEHCGAAFIKNSYLRDHLLVHTSIKRYNCDMCGKKFRYRNGLAVHRNIHTNYRGFICDTCGQGFNAKSTLKTHIKLKHSDERNWPCPECDLTFKVKSWLDKHYSRKHTLNRTKDFVCNVCGVAYLNKTTLTRHLAEKHTGTPPVRHCCTVCEKSYSTKNKLNMHMQKKHNIILNNTSSHLIL